jgi:hypothetical protein
VSATAIPGLAATARPRLIANAAEPTRNPNAVELIAPPYLDDLSATLSINPQSGFTKPTQQNFSLARIGQPLGLGA